MEPWVPPAMTPLSQPTVPYERGERPVPFLGFSTCVLMHRMEEQKAGSQERQQQKGFPFDLVGKSGAFLVPEPKMSRLEGKWSMRHFAKGEQTCHSFVLGLLADGSPESARE